MHREFQKPPSPTPTAHTRGIANQKTCFLPFQKVYRFSTLAHRVLSWGAYVRHGTNFHGSEEGAEERKDEVGQLVNNQPGFPPRLSFWFTWKQPLPPGLGHGVCQGPSGSAGERGLRQPNNEQSSDLLMTERPSEE